MGVDSHPVIFFDGVCGLCNRFVDFLLKHDRGDVFRFAPLQSEIGAAVMKQAGLEAGALSSVVLYEDCRAWTRSAAVLRVLARLGLPFSLAGVFWIVPGPVRDAVYDWIARNRYKWFGKRDVCRLPSPGEQLKFL